MQKGHAALRTLLFTAAAAPILALTACNLLKHDDATIDAGTVSIAAPTTTTETPAATTAAPVGTLAPIAPVATAPNTKPKIVKLSDGGAAAQVTLTDGGTAILPAASDGGVPGLPGFTLPTAFPSSMPTTIPTTFPSGFPTTLPSGFHLPTFPAPSASH